MAETTVKDSERAATDVEETNPDRQSARGESDDDDGLPAWFTMSVIRIGLALVGVFLLLAAIGQLSGFNLIGMGADVLSTGIGRWLLVAVVAVALIVAAVRLR